MVGIVLSPFLFAQAATGFIQALGKFPRLVIEIHTWVVFTKYLAFAVAAGLAFMAVTGATLFLSLYRQQRKRRAAKGTK